MNILCLSYEYPPLGGGGSKVVEGVCDQLIDRGRRIELLTMGFRGLSSRITRKNFCVHRIRTGRLRRHMCSALEMVPYVLLAFLKGWHICRKTNIDVIHAHFIFPDGVVASAISRITRVPYVITVHGSDVPGYNPDRFKGLHKVLRPLWRWSVSRAQFVVCPSRYLESLVKRADPDSSTLLIPNGIDTNRFTPRKNRIKRILAVTRMFERKGIQDLLRACNGIDSAWEIVVVGDGPYLQALKDLVESLTINVRFTGFLSNDSAQLIDLYENSSIFVLPSYAENFPISLLEAMDAGCAIITTEGTGCAEVTGDTALLVSPGDVEALGSQISRLTTDERLRQNLGDAARARVESNFSWEKIGCLYDKALRNASEARQKHLALR